MVRTKRMFDLVSALSLLLLTWPLLLVVAIAVKVTSRGPILHWSLRVGQNNVLFRMPKFRSMRVDAPQVPTHLLEAPSRYMTPVGEFIRKTSLDELPQLISVVTGHLSLVGPRPALFNQDDLVAMRTKCGLHELLPGITGWAQVNGRDDLPIRVKVAFDYDYMKKWSLTFDLKILVLTILRVVRQQGIAH